MSVVNPVSQFAIATHEAGHTVALLVIGHKFTSVSVGAAINDDSLGRVVLVKSQFPLGRYLPDSPYMRERETAKLDLVYLFAGGIAERLATGGAYRHGHFDDYVEAERLAWYINPDATDGDRAYHWAIAELRAEVLVRTHQETIALIADALLARNILTSTEVATIVDPAFGSFSWDDICERADTRYIDGDRPDWFNPFIARQTNDSLANAADLS